MQKTSATLLIIDDDDVVRASLAAYLEDSSFSVLQANNGLQGLQVFEQQQPDLVICDLRMPQVGGLDLIRQVTELSPDIPVIVLSGAGVMNDAVEALSGCCGLPDQTPGRPRRSGTFGSARAGSLPVVAGEPALSREAGNGQP